MKRATIIVTAILISAFSVLGFSANEEPESIDREKLAAYPHLMCGAGVFPKKPGSGPVGFLMKQAQALEWRSHLPAGVDRLDMTEQVGKADADVSPESIARDVGEFKRNLAKVLAAHVRPEEATYAMKLRAFTRPASESDVLSMAYHFRGIGTLEIDDSDGLYVTFSPSAELTGLPEVADATDPALEEFVIEAAKIILDVTEPTSVFVYPADIGQAKAGLVVYDSEYPPPTRWNSAINWLYRDGTVTFRIGKLLLEHPDIDLKNIASPIGIPEFQRKPRKFQINE